jgi:hypothetical protein
MIEPRCLINEEGRVQRLCFRAASSATENGCVGPWVHPDEKR